jgi:tRNA threonylcarbamoyl adenosine modification protein (Sua5/YciO/YrdC/YwlC family)
MRIFNDINDPELITLLKNGAVGVIPTDTVYGLVCRAADEVAVARLYEVKHRENKPGTLIAANIDQLVELGLKERYLKAVERFWPGAVSVRIPHQPNYLVDPATGTVAVRIPDYPELLDLMKQTGPLQTTSANIAGDPVAVKLSEAQAYFSDTIDFYVDGGDLSGRPPSTVIQVIDDAIEVVREGAVKIDESGRIINQ